MISVERDSWLVTRRTINESRATSKLKRTDDQASALEALQRPFARIGDLEERIELGELEQRLEVVVEIGEP